MILPTDIKGMMCTATHLLTITYTVVSKYDFNCKIMETFIFQNNNEFNTWCFRKR